MAEPRNGFVGARQAALRRAARVKRWAAGAAVALAGFFSAVAAHALPASHSTKAKPVPSAPSAPTPDLGGTQRQRTPALAPPAAPPAASSASSGAVSGGS
jgi:hypothetical protein